jgi:SAM-dependent methyltransferase
MTGVANAAQESRWNGDSGRYWIAHRERHLAIRARLTPRLLAAAGIGAGDRVLDVGCGCGEATIAAARLTGGAPVLGLDLSARMLDVARQLAAEASAQPNTRAQPNAGEQARAGEQASADARGQVAASGVDVRFELGDAQVHPLPRAAYDVVISSFGIMFFDDPAAAFGNLRTALRPAGRLAFLCWQPDARNELFGLPTTAFGDRNAPEATVFDEPARIGALLAGVGYADVRVESVVEPARLGTDVADVLGYTLGMARFRGLLDALDARGAKRVRGALAEAYRTRQRPDGVWIDVAAWLVTARPG